MKLRPAWALGSILAVGLVLRLWGLDFGLPNLNGRPDEGILVHRALAMGGGDLNPHFFNYPSLHFYLLAALYGSYYLLGHLAGWFADPQALEARFYADPSVFYLIGRLASALFGAASVALVYRLGRQQAGRGAGLLGAGFCAVSLLHVRDSHFLTADVPAIFYLLAALALLAPYRSGSGVRYLGASAALLGLAASTKYNLGLFAPSVLLAAWWGPEGSRIGRARLWRIAGAGLVAGTAFLAGTPFAVLDFPAFWRDLAFERAHFAAGHGLDLGRGWVYHLAFSLPRGLGWPLFLAGLAGCLRLARSRQGWLLLAGGVAYYAVAGSGRSVFLRYALPLVPLLCVAAGALLANLARDRPAWVAGGLALAVAAPALWASARLDQVLARTDTRVLAASWIEAHVPGGSRIALAGSDFGYPRLRPTGQWLEERAEDQQAAGFESRRLTRQLRWSESFPGPAYYPIELRSWERVAQRTVWTHYSTSRLAAEEVTWVLLHEHPLAYSRPDTALQAQLEADADLVCRIDPFRPAAAAPVYDPIDAFYAPVAGFAAVERPGPAIRIYRLRDAAR